MWTPFMDFHLDQLSPQSKSSKLITVYILVLLISPSFTSGHRRSSVSFRVIRDPMDSTGDPQEIDNRSTPDHIVSFVMCSIGKKTGGSKIDPFWYVERGVRPIGRFGKRQLKFGWNSLRSGRSNLDLILNESKKHWK